MKDGHIHTNYCPHGSSDNIEEYVLKAIENNLDEITFTEHLPMPDIEADKELIKNSVMATEDVEKYIRDVNLLKEKYKNKIKINLGFEVDYAEGYERETEEILNKYGKYIEDSILSVHFVKINNEYRAIDMERDFKYLIENLGSIEKLYDLYFNTLLKSINSDLGIYKPKRIGHTTLVRKFCRKYPYNYNNIELITKVIEGIKEKGYEIDYNTAGLRKELCGEIYPSGLFNELIEKYNINKVYGSDAHESKDVGADFNV